MQGVRRWMGTQTPANSRKSSRKSAKKTGEHSNKSKYRSSKDVGGSESIDGGGGKGTGKKLTTENVLRKVMDPYVEESEMVQYEGYINQYQTLLEEEDKYPSRKEKEVYARAVGLARGVDFGDHIGDADVTGAVEDIVVRFVQLGRPEFVDGYFRDDPEDAISGGAHGTEPVGAGGNTGGQTFNYEKWVGMGRLH